MIYTITTTYNFIIIIVSIITILIILQYIIFIVLAAYSYFKITGSTWAEKYSVCLIYQSENVSTVTLPRNDSVLLHHGIK